MGAEAVLLALEAASMALAAAGVPFALVGGAAMPAWGRVRATADADVLLHLDPAAGPGKEAISRIVDSFRGAGFAHLEKADRRRMEAMWVMHFWFPLREQGLSVRVDAILDPGPDGQEVIRRAVPRKVDGFTVPVASCEDLILLKLAAGRAVDLADARELLAINRDSLDRDYLEDRAEKRNLAAQLRALREQTG